MKRILLVDDDRSVRSILGRMLEYAGYEVVHASNGAEGIRSFRERSADLVLCDLYMEPKDGLEMIRELHREFPVVPVVAMSGGDKRGNTDLLAVAKHLGAIAVLPKPFSQVDLLAAIEDGLD
jgi:two-component system nitrogen regulation response regulator NtrX